MIIAGLFIAQTACAIMVYVLCYKALNRAVRSSAYWRGTANIESLDAARLRLIVAALKDENITLRARLSRPKLAEMNRKRGKKL